MLQLFSLVILFGLVLVCAFVTYCFFTIEKRENLRWATPAEMVVMWLELVARKFNMHKHTHMSHAPLVHKVWYIKFHLWLLNRKHLFSFLN